MNKVLWIFALMIFISCCNNEQPNIVHPKIAADNLITDSIHRTPQSDSDSGVLQYERFVNDETRDLNNFTSKIYNKFFDSLNNQFADNKNVHITIKNNLCGGDYCLSYKILNDNQTNSALYLFKADCGEYGFSNAQFLLQNDSIITVRNFDVRIQDFETNRSFTTWNIDEQIYSFSPTTVIITSRKKVVKDILFYDWKNESKPFMSETMNKSVIYDKKKRELQHLLETANYE